MTNLPGQIVNPTRISTKHAFRNALQDALNDLYTKDASTNVYRLYDTLAEQLKDADIQLKRTLSDQWISYLKNNERVVRSFSQYDLLQQEGAYGLSYIGFVPENSNTFQQVDLTAGDTSIQLDKIPASTSISSFSLTLNNQNANNLILGYDRTTNQLIIDPPTEPGGYILSYKDGGCTLARQEIVPLSRNADGLLETQLAVQDVLYDSERIFIQNSAIGVLTRDEDYTIDYASGKITALPEGRIELLSPENLDLSYRFCFDFSKLTAPAFHEQVFGETARVINETTLEISSSNVSEIFRIYNVTQRRELQPRVVSRNQITLSNDDALEVIRRTTQSVRVDSTIVQRGQVIREMSLAIRDGESKNAIQTVANTQARSRYVRVRQGGREQLPPRVSLQVPTETKTITVRTGGPDSKRSNVILKEGIHYSFRAPTPTQFDITWLDAGIAKIGNNSVYVQLFTPLNEVNPTPDPEERRFRYEVKLNAPSEIYPIEGSNIILDPAFPYVDDSNNGDTRLKEEILVTNRSGSSQFAEDLDYTYDGINRVITLNPSSSIRDEDEIRVYFLGVQEHFCDYIAVPDIITVDYDRTRNSIDWSRSQDTYNVDLTRPLGPDVNTVELTFHPDDPLDLPSIIIRSVNNPGTTLRALSYDRNQRLLVVDAPEEEDDFRIQYVGHSHIVSPGVPYYVSYNYGGRDRALRDVWSPLLGLSDTERRRFEEKQLNGNQTSVGLDYPPSDLDEIVIFLKGDSENEPATTITSYDPDTNTVSFTPLRQYGTYVVAYNTPNALTEDLRKFIIGMIEAFLIGPTKTGIERMIETFTGITPDINIATELAFKLADESFNDDPEKRSDSLNDVGFTAASPDFVPSRFNNGYQTTSKLISTLSAPAVTNVRDSEGTIEFLIGPRFNGDDGLTKYFVDIGKELTPYNNRMSIYKNERNYLVFETHDAEGQLWRVASDIGRQRTRLYRFLEKGTTSLQLTTRPAFATTDIDNDGQFDFFGAHKTEFVIRRVPGEETEDGYGYGYGYGYEGDILRNANIDITTPVNIFVHFQIPSDVVLQTVDGFDKVTRRLQAVAQQVSARGGKLVIHTSVMYLIGNARFTNVLKTLQDDGHEIGLYIDFPSFITEESDRTDHLQLGIQIAQSLGLELNTASGNPDLLGWATYAQRLELELVNGYIDPVFRESFDNRSPIVRRARLSATRGLLDVAGGEFVYLPGATYVNFSMPLSALTIQQIESTLRRAITMNDITQIASWYFTLTPDDLSSDYLTESALLGEWLTDTIAPLIELGRVRWTNMSDIGNIYRALEQYLDSLDAEEALTVDREVVVKPLTYDFDTNTISFEPVPSDGIYEFDYVSGWAAYEESEIFVAAVYKFRTDDESLPYYKLYINGELQEFVTFADFPAAGEG